MTITQLLQQCKNEKFMKIQFRAISNYTNDWVYGDLNQHPIHYECQILTNGVIANSVKKETVGQLTPFKDINGKEAYIGDLIKDTVVGLVSELVFTDYGNIGLKPLNGEIKDLEYEIIDPAWFETSAEILGNIHQNNYKT